MIRSEAERGVQPLPSDDPSVIAFKVEGLTLRVAWNASNSYQSLHCKVQPDPSMMGHWQQDPKMLQVGLLETQVHQNETNLDFLSDS